MPKNGPTQEQKGKDLSLAELAYRQIKEDILRNKFPSGEFISISDLSESLEGMGRTPVREAVQRLHDERLLIVVPRKGIIIPEFDIKKMMDQLELRFVLEKYASLRAAGRMKTETVEELEEIISEMEKGEASGAYHLARLNMTFHMRIAEVVNNQELLTNLSRIFDHHIRMYTYFLADRTRLMSTQSEHRAILAALQKGDLKRIEAAVEEHYENTRRELLEAIMT